MKHIIYKQLIFIILSISLMWASVSSSFAQNCSLAVPGAKEVGFSLDRHDPQIGREGKSGSSGFSSLTFIRNPKIIKQLERDLENESNRIKEQAARTIINEVLGEINAKVRLKALMIIKKLHPRRGSVFRGQVDMHTHNNFSDAYQTPSSLMLEAYEKGFSHIAITNHNVLTDEETFNAADILGIPVIPGVEVDIPYRGKRTHLQLFFDHDEFLKNLGEMRRHPFVAKMKKLTEIWRRRTFTLAKMVNAGEIPGLEGFRVTKDDIKKYARGSITPLDVGIALYYKYQKEFRDRGILQPKEINSRYIYKYEITQDILGATPNLKDACKFAKRFNAKIGIPHPTPKEIGSEKRLRSLIKSLSSYRIGKNRYNFLWGIEVFSHKLQEVHRTHDIEKLVDKLNARHPVFKHWPINKYPGSDAHGLWTRENQPLGLTKGYPSPKKFSIGAINQQYPKQIKTLSNVPLQFPEPDERKLSLEAYPNLFSAVRAMYEKQRLAGHINPKTGNMEPFFKYGDIWKQSSHMVFQLWGGKVLTFIGDVHPHLRHVANLIATYYGELSRKPGVANIQTQRLKLHSSKSLKILPETMHKESLDQYWFEWGGPSRNKWEFTFNPYTLWPPGEHLSESEQVYHLLMKRAGSFIPQSQMHTIENIRDCIRALVELNQSLCFEGNAFWLAINGWYYSQEKKAPKAGATQAHAHAQFMRFYYPIARALPAYGGFKDDVYIFKIADGMGTGIILNCFTEAEEQIVQLIHKILSQIISKGHSFNVLGYVSEDNQIAIYIADRPLGIADPYFLHEWGYNEFGRNIYVRSIEELFSGLITKPPHGRQWSIDEISMFASIDRIRKDLYERCIKGIRMITAPQEEIDQIVQNLVKKDEGPESRIPQKLVDDLQQDNKSKKSIEESK